MKTAVLFGSFNPLTNAHPAIMNRAVESLHADRGLFVATNGQYLRRKTVKLNAPAVVINEEACRSAEEPVLYYGETAEEA